MGSAQSKGGCSYVLGRRGRSRVAAFDSSAHTPRPLPPCRQIIDNKNHGFLAGKWSSDRQNDLRYWKRLPGCNAISSAMDRNLGQNIDTSTLPYLYMRWKELCFIDSNEECDLTLSGTPLVHNRRLELVFMCRSQFVFCLLVRRLPTSPQIFSSSF